MLPVDLKAEDFRQYPPEAQALAVRNLQLLRSLPLGVLPLVLREVIAYDWRFPAERDDLDQQFRYLAKLTPAEFGREMQPFAALRLSPDLEQFDWINKPEQFSEKLSAHLWATHQMDAFRQASIDYVHHLNVARVQPTLPIPRVSLVVIGKGVTNNNYPVFRKLRPHGVQFTNVAADGGLATLFDFVQTRAKVSPVPFGHWYIEGGTSEIIDGKVVSISYRGLDSVRATLLRKMVTTLQTGRGPEALRTELAAMRPSEVGLPDNGPQGILSRFQLSLLTEGSGTQIFSTTFAQWAARESLRRAQPVTLLVRFAPRQRESLLAPVSFSDSSSLDPQGSLMDADMAAYYTWINQARLSGADQSGFLVWFEGHPLAFAAGPNIVANTTDSNRTTLREVLARIS